MHLLTFSTLLLNGLFIPAVLSVDKDNKVLVLSDDASIKETHASFLADLTLSGFELTFKNADDPSIALKRYGEYAYGHVALLSPGAEELGGSLSVEALAEFADDGGNVFVAASHNGGQVARELATEFGFEMDDEKSMVIDHGAFDETKDDGMHTTVVADRKGLIKAEAIVGKDSKQPLLFKGAGLITDRENPLVIDILTASSTAYSYNPNRPIKDYPHATGKSTVLIAGLQARNNARVVFSGSLDFFSDNFFDSPLRVKGSEKTSGNRQLALSLARWCFKRSGVIRAVQTQHHLVGQTKSPPFYTITEDAEFSITIEELNEKGKWIPYSASDVQMEFVRIDPFVRLNLKADGKGKFSVRFTIPDVYGVFQFKVSYARPGYTRLHSATQVSVRPLMHDQYERFIPSAYPYYASAFSMMFGVFIFSLVFLHHKEDKTKTE